VCKMDGIEHRTSCRHRIQNPMLVRAAISVKQKRARSSNG
jgi:hypothetical protein